jgi:hypothetical protein
MQSETGTVDYAQIKAIEGLTIIYTDEEYAFCKQFATDCYRDGVYKNQNNKTKIIVQHTLGKLAEIAVARLLHDHGCSEPDFAIGWEHAQFLPDLTVFPFNLHIKAVEPNVVYGTGFTFQYEKNKPRGKPRRDHIFESNDPIHDIVICCTVHRTIRMKNTITIYDINTWGVVKPLLCFDEMRDNIDLKDQKLFYHPVKSKELMGVLRA